MTRRKTVKHVTVENIGAFIAHVEANTETTWFRGHGMSDLYKLKPTLYRTSTAKTHTEYYHVEYDMIKKFRQRSIPFVGDRSRDSDLDILFFMQHYGIPTRLLDWTENPTVALYFALHDPYNFDTKTGYIEDCSVWAIRPDIWNNAALGLDAEFGILSWPEDDPMKGYVPLKSRDSNVTRQKYPVAIEGRHNSPRIVAQRGTFMIYGTDSRDMEDIYIKENFPVDSLIKIIIPKQHIESMQASLYRMGITDSVIYPDLQGLAKEMRHQFGY